MEPTLGPGRFLAELSGSFLAWELGLSAWDPAPDRGPWALPKVREWRRTPSFVTSLVVLESNEWEDGYQPLLRALGSWSR